MEICVFGNVRIRARWIGPYAWRNVRNQFRGCSQRYRKTSAALSQTVSSRRGPIYRARIYVYTHEMENGNLRVVMWKCVFNNVKTHIRWCENTYLIIWKYVFSYGNTRFWLRKDTGTMNRSPTPGRPFVTISRNIRNTLTTCLLY